MAHFYALGSTSGRALSQPQTGAGDKEVWRLENPNPQKCECLLLYRKERIPKVRESSRKGTKLAVGVRNLPALSFFPDVFQQEPNNICSKCLLSTARIEDWAGPGAADRKTKEEKAEFCSGNLKVRVHQTRPHLSAVVWIKDRGHV